jgi:ParB family chromosome partitioning protein
MAEEARSRLGRGLASLIGDMGAEKAPQPAAGRGQRRVPVEHLRPNPRNPRKQFAEAELDELAASIRERGIIQPIVVRAVKGAGETFEIVAGERRWRAAQRAAMHDVPVVVVEVNDNEALQLAIIENVQRADLNALEEAAGYQSLADQFNHSQDEIAKLVGKSRSHVANTLRLMKLPEAVKAFLRSGQLSAGHARTLIGHADAERMARDIVERGLNVRQVEDMAREDAQHSGAGKASGGSRAKARKDPDTVAMEKRVSDALGLAVTIDHGSKGGTVHVAYRDLDQLDEIARRLSRR